MANDMIRMSGMNSGLDTEAIINALTANTKLKATKQERNVLKYEATQEAYRDIISKMQNVKNKYFDILKKDSYLSGSTIWNKYSATVENSAGLAQAGLAVATSLNSQEGEYTIRVKDNATQAKLKGTALTSSDKPNLKADTEEGGALVSGTTYGVTVTVGGVEKNISFVAGADERESRHNLNQALEDAFGESNDSVGEGVKGMVYVDESGSFVSREGKSISFSGIGVMQDTNTLNLSNAKKGTNTFTIRAGDQTENVSFQSIPDDYFSNILKSDGSVLSPYTVSDDSTQYYENLEGVKNPEWDAKVAELAADALGAGASAEELEAKKAEINDEMMSARSLYLSIADNYKESVDFKKFTDWRDDNKDTSAWSSMEDDLYNIYVGIDKKERISKWINDSSEPEGDEPASTARQLFEKYETYKNTQIANGGEVKDVYDWASADDASDDVKALYQKLDDKYNGLGDGENAYGDDYYDEQYKNYKNTFARNALADTSAQADYNDYVSNVAEGDEAMDFYTWAKSDLSSEEITNALTSAESDTDDPLLSQADWKNDKIVSDGWQIKKSAVTGNEKLMFKAFRESSYKTGSYASNYDMSSDNIIDFFNETSLKNSIGNLTLSDGTKFEVNYNKATNKAEISAYKETTTGEGDDAVTTKTPVSFSMTAASGSANSFGTNAAKNTVTQISSSSKLSELGADADENGNYNFKINGVSFSFDGETTVNDMLKKVNASSAGVKMAYSALDNRFTVTSSQYGLDGKIDFDGTDDSETSLLSRIGLRDETVEAGHNLVVEMKNADSDEWTSYETTGNTVEVDGTTFTITNKFTKESGEVSVTIGKDTSAIKDLVKGFVEDYNKLIDDVYKYLDEKPEKDYYFLTDTDKEDLDLTEKQEEKWEEKSKKGLLYHDSLTSSVMTSLRSALMGSIEGLDGDVFSLSSMGIKTVTDYSQHGKLVLNEDDLDAAITNHLDDIQKLFSDGENGIMKKFSAALDAGVGTTGENKGTLIRKAGLASGSSATNNEIYNAIKRTKTKITSLNARYESEQNRLWKRYSNMESLLGTLNSQQTSFSSYFMQ